MSTPEDTDPRDRLFWILSTELDRHVLHFFRESSEIVASLEELADYVVSQRSTEFGGPHQVAIRLHHSTIPKLTDVGVVDYDIRENIVRYLGHPSLDGGIRHHGGIDEEVS